MILAHMIRLYGLYINILLCKVMHRMWHYVSFE